MNALGYPRLLGIGRWLGVMACAAALLVSAPAGAEPATANSLQLGLGFRYGFNLKSGPNPFGLGIGLDGGYTLPSAVYLGGNFDYFFGENESDSGLGQLAAEAGYDLGLGENFVVRPKVGAGIAFADSDAYFALAPGLKLMLFTSAVSLSTDFRYDMVFADPMLNALIFSAGIGF